MQSNSIGHTRRALIEAVFEPQGDPIDALAAVVNDLRHQRDRKVQALTAWREQDMVRVPVQDDDNDS